MRTLIDLASPLSLLRSTRAPCAVAAMAAALVLVGASAVRAEEPASDVSEPVASEDEPVTSENEPVASEEFPEDDLTPWFDKAFDVFPLRVMGAVQFAVGCVMLVPAWPLSWPGGGHTEVMELLFWSPFDYTFRRPLGEF